MSSTQVSVVMGVYNAERVVERTLDSVLSQEDCDFEFIVVDDGSRDRTGEILDKRAAADPRLIVIHQANAGLTRALIAGCEAARGEFIARQDAGDVSIAGRLGKQAAVLRADSQLAFVSCPTRYVDSDGDLLYETRGSGVATGSTRIIDLSRDHGTLDGPSSHPSVMFRRSLYEAAGGYRAEFYFGQDWDLWYRLAELGSFRMLPETLMQVYLQPGDISMQWKPVQEQYAKLSFEALKCRARGDAEDDVLAAARALGQSRKPVPPTSAQAAATAYFFGECLRRSGRVSKAEAQFRAAIRHNPLHLRSWARLVQLGVAGR